MAPSSMSTYIVEGLKISLEILKDMSNDLPPPASSIINLAIRVIVIIETLKKNREKCDQLRDRLLRLLPVITVAIRDAARGTKGVAAIAPDLRQNLEHLQENLQTIVEQVEELEKTVKSKRIRRKVAAIFLGNEHASALQQCYDDLDWAIKEFDVASRVGDAVRLCEVVEKVRSILTNQAFQSLPRAKYAGFDSGRPDKASNCFEGTRTTILQDIAEWMKNPDPAVQCIFWLSGIAGVGKTTVARTAAQQAQDAGILGGQFFFSRKGEAELRNPALVFTTIAYQLARFDPEFGQRIIAALEAEPDAPFASPKNQLAKLIIEPLSGIQRDPERVVVIVFDAFDECESQGAKEILQLLIAAIPRLPFFLKILITSRPEQHIRSILLPSNKLHITALHDIEASIVTSDIKLYLTARLRSLPKELGLDLPPDWVKEHEIEMLADKAGNLFIHAATSLRFLLEALDLPAQLKRLLKIVESNRRSSTGDTPFADLDKLYMEILCGLITERNKAEMVRMLQRVVGTVVLLRDPLPVDALGHLIGLSSSGISKTLACLSSVVLLPTTPDECPRVYHPSFPDFLQDDTRCTDAKFRIDTQVHEQRLALHCLNLINAELHKGMLGDMDPVLLNKEVPDLKSKVQAAFSLELQYACRYWASHVVAVVDGSDPAFLKSLELFTTKSLLPWVEAMSWLGEVRLCLLSLDTVDSWAANAACSAITKSLLTDAHRMVLAHFSTIASGAQHIARSILPFLPRNIPLTSQYKEYADAAVTVICGPEDEWPACLTVLTSHSGEVESVAISPNGLRIASGAADENIFIWDSVSGSPLARLDGHAGVVGSVAFSPDGQQLASGSADGNVRIWEVASGTCLAVLEGHARHVTSIAFSPDTSRRQVASGSYDRTVRVWDTVDGSCLTTLEGHSDMVMQVAFSPNGTRLASGSWDKTVRIWDPNNATCVSALQHSAEVTSVAFSPDGLFVASGSRDFKTWLWEVSTGINRVFLTGHEKSVQCVTFSPDGRHVASGSLDCTIRIWNKADLTSLLTLQGHTQGVSSVAFSHDGSRLVSGSDDHTVRVWNTSRSTSHPPSKGSIEWAHTVIFSADGSRLAIGSSDPNIQIWDTNMGSCIATLPSTDEDGAYTCFAFSPDNARVAAGLGNSLHIWDTHSASYIATLEGHSSTISSVSFSPDGSRLVSGDYAKIIRIWDMSSTICLTTVKGGSGVATSLAFSPTSIYLAAGTSGDSVQLWNVATGNCVATLKGHFIGTPSFTYASTVAFSPNGLQIGSRSKSGPIFVWDVPTAQRVDPSSYEICSNFTRLHLELEGHSLFRKDTSGTRHLLCIVPAAYHVLFVDFFVFETGRARIVLACRDPALVILDVALP